jgi:MerR family transcriptional regulator/heat shock protein HspR
VSAKKFTEPQDNAPAEPARGTDRAPVSRSQAVYAMAVATELTGVNPPMLRAYEEKGLISPHRTRGGTRRYSADDISAIHHISDLLAEGLNLAGVEAVLALEKENRSLRAELERLRR